MGKKAGVIVIAAVNIIGLICLIYFAVPYITHDVTVANPDAMLPMERWDGCGMALTIGMIPLGIVNLLAFLYIGEGKLKTVYRALFFVPCLICFVLVAHYWILSLTSK